MQPPDDFSNKLSDLRMRLEQANRSWTINDYESLLKFYVSIVPQVMEAERCNIFIVDQETNEIWLKYGTGLREKDIIPPKEGSIVEKAITSGKWIIANDLEKSFCNTDLSSKTKFTARNLICTPIKSLTEQGIAGAIEVSNKRGGDCLLPMTGSFCRKLRTTFPWPWKIYFLTRKYYRYPAG